MSECEWVRTGGGDRKAKANCKRWEKNNKEGLRMGLRNSVIYPKGASVTEKEKKTRKNKWRIRNCLCILKMRDSKKVRLLFGIIINKKNNLFFVNLTSWLKKYSVSIDRAASVNRVTLFFLTLWLWGWDQSVVSETDLGARTRATYIKLTLCQTLPAWSSI